MKIAQKGPGQFRGQFIPADEAAAAQSPGLGEIQGRHGGSPVPGHQPGQALAQARFGRGLETVGDFQKFSQGAQKAGLLQFRGGHQGLDPVRIPAEVFPQALQGFQPGPEGGQGRLARPGPASGPGQFLFRPPAVGLAPDAHFAGG